MMEDDSAPELFEEVERRAYLELPDDEADDAGIDLVAAFGDAGPEVDASEAGDLTLGGYIDLHNRPPAFSGLDGQPYTVDIDAEPTGDPAKPYAAFLVFLRWAETGAGIMGHTESEDVRFAESPEAAIAAAMELTLYEVKAELDAAITRKQQHLEG